jgi:hypothetical protein
MIESWKLALCLIAAIAGLACSQQDIPGTYEVELMIEGARAPTEATMILTTTYFEPSSRAYDAMPDRDETSGEPNSCLILPSLDPNDQTARGVSVFETRIQGGEFLVPVTIFDTGEQRMEITELSFFAGAAGGKLAFYDEQGRREGQIVGSRVGGPDGMRCGAELAKFHARIDQLLESN